jgi:hypothetical protein
MTAWERLQLLVGEFGEEQAERALELLSPLIGADARPDQQVRRLGGTDASVAAICERLGIVTVATVNLRDFAAVRPHHIPAFITGPRLS